MKQTILILFLLSYYSLTARGQSWMQLADSAKKLAVAKKNGEAIIIYKQALSEAVKDSSQALFGASINDRIGELALGMENFKMAEQHLKDAITIREKISGKNDLDYASTANNLGSVYTSLGSPALGLPVLLAAQAIREKELGTDNLDYAATCDNLGTTYYRLGKVKESESLFIKGRNIREQKLGKLHADYLTSSINLANVYYSLQRTPEALDLYEEVRRQSVLSAGRDNLVYIRATLNKGSILHSLGQIANAELLLVETYELLEKNNFANPLLRGLCYQNLGDIYLIHARFSEGQPLLERAKEIALKSFNKTHFLYYNAANSLGQLYVALAQFDKANENLVEARSIIEKVVGKQSYQYGLTSKGLGQMYFNMSLNDEAAPYLEEALVISRAVSGENSLDYAEACMVNGILYYNTNDFSKSGEFFKTARDIYIKLSGKNSRNYSEASYYLGRLYVKAGQYQLAEPILLEAKTYAEQSILGTQNRTYAEICEHLAIMYWNLGDRETAVKYFSLEDNVQHATIKNYFLISAEKEQYAYARRLNRFINLYYSFNHVIPGKDDGMRAYQLSLRNRNIVLSSTRQLRHLMSDAKDPVLHQKYNEWMATREQIASIGSSRDAARLLENKAQQQETELARLSMGFRRIQQHEESTWETIQQHLQPGEAAIEFVSFQYFNGKTFTDSVLYSAIILRKDRQPVVVALCEQSQIETILEERSVDKARSIDMHYASDKLSRLVWQPLEPWLNEVKTIYFAPSGILHKISFAALKLDEQQLLSDKYRIEQLFSTSSVAGLHDSGIKVPDKIAVYGGISYGADSGSLKNAAARYRNADLSRSTSAGFSPMGEFQQFPPLPNSEIELNAIVKAARLKKLEIVSFSGVLANEESVKAFNGTSSPAILHFATHGFFFPDLLDNPKTKEYGGNAFRNSEDPLFRSGLILAGAEHSWKGKPVAGLEDGILTAYEVAGLYLPNTKLVVLSACETGAGEVMVNEGVFGLQRAFKIAGVQNLIMSLWDVNDIAASEFMQEFYQILLSDKGISESFQLAQSKMKSKYRAKPHIWAGFVLIR